MDGGEGTGGDAGANLSPTTIHSPFSCCVWGMLHRTCPASTLAAPLHAGATDGAKKGMADD
ncbi:MAG TPA: hypothetical protein ENN44_05425 [Methanoculleus sp.]|nr:hypothetical protein [Methanoculleus sp.]